MRFLQASFIALLSFFTWQVNAQQTPAAPQSEPILLLGGVAHLGNGKVIENSAIAFEDGKITMVADATVIRIDGDRYLSLIHI